MRRLLPTSLLRQCRAPIIHPGPSIPLTSIRFAHSRSAKHRKAVNRARDPPPETEPLPEDVDEATQLNAYMYESIHRTAPHDVYERRKKWPAHRERSHYVLSDPDFRTGSSTIKRLPLDLEDTLDKYRACGLLPGTEDEARKDFLEILTNWRNRIRGYISEVWIDANKQWADKSKEVFFWTEAKERYPGLVYPPFETPFDSVQSLYLAGQIWLNESEVNMEELAKRHSTSDLVTRLQNLREDMDLVDWDAVAARTPANSELWSKIRKRTTGYRIYLPNVQVVLRRNNTPVDQPYDPMIATFRIPLSMTKTDLRSYLYSCYGLDVTFIRTDIRRGEIVRGRNGQRARQKGFAHNYKRAVVGLKEPFHYPDDVVELQAWGHSVGLGDKYKDYREDYLDRAFSLSQTKVLLKERRAKMHKMQRDPRRYKSIADVTLKKDAMPGGRGRYVAAEQSATDKRREIRLKAIELRRAQEEREQPEPEPEPIRAVG